MTTTPQVNVVQKNADTRQTPQANLPGNLEECFAELKRTLSEQSLKEIQDSDEKGMSRYHFGLGVGIRNQWIRHGDPRLRDYFKKLGIHHPDDMSGIILTTFWRHLHKRPWALEEQIAHYQAYWADAKLRKTRGASPRPMRPR